MSIIKILKEAGLVAEPVYNQSTIKVCEIDSGELAFELTGMELFNAMNHSEDKTEDLIKEKIKEYQNK